MRNEDTYLPTELVIMEQEPPGILDELMLRGERMRKLRLLALADEQERFLDGGISLTGTSVSTSSESSLVECEGDKIDILPDSKHRVLRYESYLSHQRYFDDYKHADCNLIDFGAIRKSCKGRLVIEQQKSLGKGGLVWDAAYVLGDHLLTTERDWNRYSNYNATENTQETKRMTKILELGAGTGVCGLMLAKALPDTHVYITDLPDLLKLMERNVMRNFTASSYSLPYNHLNIENILKIHRGEAACEIPNVSKVTLEKHGSSSCLSHRDLEVIFDSNSVDDAKQSEGHVTATVLRWGEKEDYTDAPFDVIVAADVVTTLYDPVALAKTIYDLSHENTQIFISMKKRYTETHIIFENALIALFDSLMKITPITRHKNPNESIHIIRVSGKR